MKQKICIISCYPIYPPINGGRLRVYSIAKNLAEYFDVQVLTISPNPNLNENIQIGKLKIRNIGGLAFFSGDLISRILMLPIEETFLPFSSQLAFKFKNILKETVKSSDIILLERPYLFPVVEKYCNNKKIIYDSHDVEILIKEGIYQKNTLIKKILLPIVEKTEKSACSRSDIILMTSKEDKNKIKKVYDICAEKIYIAPNGVDCSGILSPSLSEKDKAKRKLNLENEKTVLFIGSDHPPNIEAAMYIISHLAPKLPEYKFLIVGTVKNKIKNAYPVNVKLTGIVDDETKKDILKAADIALNPLFYGSGTNVKILEYLAAGIPTVTTPVGARGIELQNNKNIIITEIENFDSTIEFLFSNICLMETISQKGRQLVEEKYDWKIISKDIADILVNC